MIFLVEVAKKTNFFLNKFMIISSLKMEGQKSDWQYCTDLCGFQRFIDFFSLTFWLHKGKESELAGKILSKNNITTRVGANYFFCKKSLI